MDVALSPRKTDSKKSRTPATVNRPNTSQYAIDEINAYMAVRDGLLEEAEQNPTEASIHRLVLANDFVKNCLGPARDPYITQCLPKVDAVRELQHCQTIEARMVKIRASVIKAA